MTVVLPCLACGSANRVPEEKLDLGGTLRCGRCRAPLRSRRAVEPHGDAAA